MRLTALLGTTMFPMVLFLGGCSGLGKFLGDTITLPGMNPTMPFGVSENSDRARGQRPAESPILPEPGNVWPGPPQPLPTLNEASHEQGNALSGGIGQGGGGQNGGASMHDGGSMSLGESQSVSHGADPGADSFSGGAPGASALGDHVPDASSRYRVKPTAGKGGAIVIPNGDGTSTVIDPDGTVKTVKDPAK